MPWARPGRWARVSSVSTEHSEALQLLPAVDVKDGDKTVTLCSDTKVESNTDDWSGYRPSLARTGAAIGGMLLAVVAVGALGTGLLLARRKAAGTAPHGAHFGR